MTEPAHYRSVVYMCPICKRRRRALLLGNVEVSSRDDVREDETSGAIVKCALCEFVERRERDIP